MIQREFKTRVRSFPVTVVAEVDQHEGVEYVSDYNLLRPDGGDANWLKSRLTLREEGDLQRMILNK